jgi:vacuolar iron transporter family protein
MSLVVLKNALLGRRPSKTLDLRTDPLQIPDKRQHVARQSSTPSSISASPDDIDLESQTSADQNNKGTQRKRFKIDARVISDATIGLSDGLTVPFALTAGLSALGNTRVVIFGGLAELIAGAISMGLGGYLGAKSELLVSHALPRSGSGSFLTDSINRASYRESRAQTERLVASSPSIVMEDIRSVFRPYDIPTATLDDLTKHLSTSSKLTDFVMCFQHCAPEPASSRAFTSALTIAMGYFLGGLLPLIPYFCVPPQDLYTGLYISIGVMAFALFTFGYVKTCVVTGWRTRHCVLQGVLGGVQMVVVGGAAAGAAMGLVKAFNHVIGPSG